jgi:hypothetical protein
MPVGQSCDVVMQRCDLVGSDTDEGLIDVTDGNSVYDVASKINLADFIDPPGK